MGTPLSQTLCLEGVNLLLICPDARAPTFAMDTSRNGRWVGCFCTLLPACSVHNGSLCYSAVSVVVIKL